MLRVYSILYIEKLWRPSPAPLLRQVASTHSYLQTTLVSNVEQERSIVDEEEEEPLESRQTFEQPEQEVEVEYEEQPDNNENDFGVMTVEMIPEEEEEELRPAQEQEQEHKDEEVRPDNRRDSKVSDDVPQVAADEDIVKSLTIDTQQRQDKNNSGTSSDELFEEPSAIAASLSSASSSLVPPATPDSIHSSTNNEKSPSASPRTTSLIRRETNKLNDKRKSLTKKLKRALSAKTSGTTNKRNSV